MMIVVIDLGAALMMRRREWDRRHPARRQCSISSNIKEQSLGRAANSSGILDRAAMVPFDCRFHPRLGRSVY